MAGVFTKIPANTFKQLAINAGVLLNDFDPTTATYTDEDMIGPTTGGVNFTATPTYSDYGEDIDNCPKNTKELKRLDDWEVKMSGTFIAVTADLARRLTALADISGNKITPRSTVDVANDFMDVWLVADYSDVNTGANAGFIAIHLMNALSTGGFQIQTADKAKGQFSFEFTGHFSMDAQDTVPFEIYIKGGTASTSGSGSGSGSGTGNSGTGN